MKTSGVKPIFKHLPNVKEIIVFSSIVAGLRNILQERKQLMRETIFFSILLVLFITICGTPGSAQVNLTHEIKAKVERLKHECEAKKMTACLDLAYEFWEGRVTGWVERKQGYFAFKRGVTIDSTGPLANLQQKCDTGDSRSCCNLGFMFSLGVTVPIDKSMAAKLYQKACTGGEPWGCLNLGSLYEDGEGVPQDKAKTRELFLKACDAGIPSGCLDLGHMYYRGIDISKDFLKSAEFYKKACDGGFASACYNLGIMYANSQGVTKDEATAARLYQKGCDGGEAGSCTNIGYAYAMGNGVIKDEERAAELYQKACDIGNKLGCDNFWSLQSDRSSKRIVKFKGSLYRIHGPLSLSLPSGGSVTTEYIKYVGRELMVSVPKAGSQFAVGPINVTPLHVDRTPGGETQQLECSRQTWNSKTRRLELTYRRNQLNIVIDILPVGFTGFITTKVVILSQ